MGSGGVGPGSTGPDGTSSRGLVPVVWVWVVRVPVVQVPMGRSGWCGSRCRSRWVPFVPSSPCRSEGGRRRRNREGTEGRPREDVSYCREYRHPGVTNIQLLCFSCVGDVYLLFFGGLPFTLITFKRLGRLIEPPPTRPNARDLVTAKN